jgi:hypothetical protein
VVGGGAHATVPGVEALEGIGEGDRHLGRPVPLPRMPLPLVRWVEVHAVGPEAVEVEWNLDDTRAGAPGRLALYAGSAAPPARDIPDAGESQAVTAGPHRVALRSAALPEAQPSLRPVHELRWEAGGLHLRMTAQGPWEVEDLLAIAATIEA